jgi:hypothetical protein
MDNTFLFLSFLCSGPECLYRLFTWCWSVSITWMTFAFGYFSFVVWGDAVEDT